MNLQKTFINNTGYRKNLLASSIFTMSFFLLGNINLLAQCYIIDNFSKQYRVEIKINDQIKDSTNQQCTFIIRDKLTHRELLKIDKLILNIGKKNHKKHMLSYDQQELFIYKDFNFDGQKDFAIKDNGSTSSCYGGSEYRIYLMNKHNFRYSDVFSNLTKFPFCGMFSIDAKNKQIITSSKSGCCILSKTYFNVINDTVIKAVKKIETKFNPSDSTVRKKTIYFKY